MNFTILFRHGKFCHVHHQLFRTMKLVVFIIFIAILQVHASTFGQNVTLHEKNASLTTVLAQISKQTGYDFFYSNKTIKKAKPVSINLQNVSLKEALDRCFEEQPLDYTIENTAVTVSEKKTLDIKLPLPVANFQPGTFTMTGIVADENDRPLPGATIFIKDSKLSTISDARGGFTLANVPENSTVVISFIGYKRIEAKAQSSLGRVRLGVASSDLDQVQIIAHGQTTQRYNIG
jgi:hypothetical protein